MSKQGGELTITADEQQDYQRFNKVIHGGKQTYLDVGFAMMNIRDRRLYREHYKTFEDFCQQEHGFTRQYANRLIGATKVVGDLETKVSKPTTEAQVRELKKAPPEKRAEAWKEASKNGDGKPTAVEVRRAVDKVAPSIREAITKPVEEETPKDPWGDVNATIDASILFLKQATACMRRGFEAEGQELKGKYAKRLSWSGSIGAVNAIIRYLEGERIVGEDKKGIITANDDKKAKSLKGAS